MPSRELTRRALMCRALLTVPWLARAAWGFGRSAPLDQLAHGLLNALHSAALTSFLAEWPVSSKRRPSLPTSLPVLRWLPTLRDQAPPFSAPFADTLAREAPMLAWRRSYALPDVSSQFLENYGWTEIAGLTGPLASEHLACGALLLGPHTLYPAHHHEAEEIYVLLSGTAEWKQGSGEWQEEIPGTVIHHRPNESHAMRTLKTPLLALYLWRSGNLDQKSQLDEQQS